VLDIKQYLYLPGATTLTAAVQWRWSQNKVPQSQARCTLCQNQLI